VLLTGIGLAQTRSEVMRLLKQGAVRVDDVRHPSGDRSLAVRPGDVRLFRVGRRKFARVTFDG
jgi:tyrosyl-tRNA synthetase